MYEVKEKKIVDMAMQSHTFYKNTEPVLKGSRNN